MAKKIYTVEEVKEMYKDNFYVQHKDEMAQVDVKPSTSEIDQADIGTQFIVIDDKYDREYNNQTLLERAQYNHYLDVIASEKNKREINTLSAQDKALLRKSGVEV